MTVALGTYSARDLVRDVFADAFRPRLRLTVDEWADQHRRLTAEASDEPGPWRTSRLPYLREPMRCWTEDGVSMVVLQFASQTGKTEAMFNCLAYTIDEDPAPIMLVYPNADRARQINKNRLIPSLKASPRTRSRFTGRKWDEKSLEVIFTTCVMYLTGANSAANLASHPIGRVFGDEIDKWPELTGGREGAALDLLLDRLDAFQRGRAFLPSTPTDPGVGVHKLYQLSDQARYHVPCPFCGHYQTLEWNIDPDTPGGVRWEGGSGVDMEDDEHAAHCERVRRTAWYECRACREAIHNAHKPVMLRGGVWVRRGQSVGEGGEVVGERPESSIRGFQLSKLYSPFRGFGDVAWGYVKARGEMERAWVNSDLGLPYAQEADRTESEELMGFVREQIEVDTSPRYQRGTAPEPALILTGAIDVQRDVVYVEVVGWGERETRFLVDWACLSCPEIGTVHAAESAEDNWAKVVEFMAREYPHVGHERPMCAQLWAIDCGYRTKEVYDFARRMGPSVVPVMGHWEISLPWQESLVDRLPDGTPFRGGVRRMMVQSDHWKDVVFARSRRVWPRHGAYVWPTDMTNDYIRQFTAEERVQQKRKNGSIKWTWLPRAGTRHNHYWDCANYNQALADSRGLRTLSRGGPKRDRPQRLGWR